jgi:hypothetical protein
MPMDFGAEAPAPHGQIRHGYRSGLRPLWFRLVDGGVRPRLSRAAAAHLREHVRYAAGDAAAAGGAVLDSNDAGVAHWIGRCRLPAIVARNPGHWVFSTSEREDWVRL